MYPDWRFELMDRLAHLPSDMVESMASAVVQAPIGRSVNTG
jgi:hypothetical protein